MSRPQKPLGWWDTSPPLRPLQRMVNQRLKILGLLKALQGRADYGAIAGFTHQVLNLAAAKSEMQQLAEALLMHRKLRAALKKLARSSLPFAEIRKEIE